jgi:hypothetical protein
MYQNESAPWLLFRAWNTDGTPKTDLVYNTAGIVLYQARNNEAKTTITLSNAASATDWAAGKFWQISGNLYRVGASTASISSYTGVITVQGSYTGGTLDGIAVEVNVVPNTVAPATPANVTTSTSTITALLPAALVGGRMDASVGSNLDKTGYSLATTQPSITWQPQTITAGDGNPNITLAGSGNADGIAWTRSGSGDPLDSDFVDQIQSGLATSVELPANFDTLVITAGDIAGTVGGIAGTITTFDELDTALDAAHGDGSWEDAGGGGGSATIENQEAILAALTGVEVVQTPSPNVLGDLVLTQGDQYDDVANPKARWTVATDYTDGWSVALTIRDSEDAVVYATAGEVLSSTVVAVSIDAPTGLTFTGCPGTWQGKFDVQLTKGTSRKTIAIGVAYVNEDQTRT